METLKANIFNNALCLSYSTQATSDNSIAGLNAIANRDKRTMFNMQAELDMLNFKYDAVFNSDDSYFIILDRVFNILDFNLASDRVVQTVFERQLVKGENIAGYMSRNLRETIMDNCMRALSGDTFSVEQKVDHNGDVVSWWHAEYSPAYDAEHNIKGIIFYAVDITMRKNRDAKIEAQNEQLKAIALIQSHDIRGPLCTLMGLMDLMKAEDPLGQSPYLLMMEETVAMLDSKIRGIIDFASEDDTAG